MLPFRLTQVRQKIPELSARSASSGSYPSYYTDVPSWCCGSRSLPVNFSSHPSHSSLSTNFYHPFLVPIIAQFPSLYPSSFTLPCPQTSFFDYFIFSRRRVVKRVSVIEASPTYNLMWQFNGRYLEIRSQILFLWLRSNQVEYFMLLFALMKSM